MLERVGPDLGSTNSVAGAEGAVDELFSVRTVPFAFHGARLEFSLAATLFSSSGVDPGSAQLLRYLQSVELPPAARILDLGCGHGVLGVVLAALDPGRAVTFVDRDALACRYTARNLALNGLVSARMTIGGSLGYDGVSSAEPFDLIVSNVPGKAGAPVITHLVAGMGRRARPGTLVGLVVVTPLAPLVAEILATQPIELLVDRGNKTHHVFIGRLTAQPDGAPTGFPAGTYDRHSARFNVGDLSWSARTVTGLDEFDSLSHGTQLLRGALRGIRAGNCVIVNPGQGHRAVIAARSGQQPGLVVARDLLALQASARCLADNGQVGSDRPAPTMVHDVALPARALATGRPRRSGSTVILHADDKVHAPWFTQQVQWCLGQLAGRPAGSGPESHLVLTGRASLLGRLEADLISRTRGRPAHRESRRGHRAVRYVF